MILYILQFIVYITIYLFWDVFSFAYKPDSKSCESADAQFTCAFSLGDMALCWPRNSCEQIDLKFRNV